MKPGDLVQINTPWSRYFHGALGLVHSVGIGAGIVRVRIGATRDPSPFAQPLRPNDPPGVYRSYYPAELIKRARFYPRPHNPRMKRKGAAMSPETNATNIPNGMRLERRPTLSTRCDERPLLRDERGNVRAVVETWTPEPTAWN